jgi:hypothetical protein
MIRVVIGATVLAAMPFLGAAFVLLAAAMGGH